MQYLFRNKAEVPPLKKNKIVIRPPDVSIATFSRRLGFLLQKIAHYLSSLTFPLAWMILKVFLLGGVKLI